MASTTTLDRPAGDGTRLRGSERRLSLAGKLALGALGGMTPLVASLMLADVEVVAGFIERALAGGEPYHLIGYVVRMIGLTGLGALWVYLHRNEYEPLKVFQLGIVAPAMIAGFINASNVHQLRNPDAPPAVAFNLSLIPDAHADQHGARDERPKKPSVAGKVLRGFLGKR